jgi:hypothetical protein
LRYAARADENQPAIVDALRKAGATVTPIHTLGKGVSDLLVSFRQRWLVLEVKNPTKPKRDRELTEDEKTWIGKQRAPVYIVFTPEDALMILREVQP